MKLSPHARAIRDVEDEELRSFFYGMSPWQVNGLICEILHRLGRRTKHSLEGCGNLSQQNLF